MENVKKCSKCLRDLELKDFFKQKSHKDGLRSACKSCTGKLSKRYYDTNIEEISVRRKSYHQANLEVERAKLRLWSKTHSKQKQVYKKRMLRENPQFKLQELLRSRLKKALKNEPKRGSAIKDLGCSIEELKTYLESKFQLGMSWDNYGFYGWHIDHVRPLTSFDLTDTEEIKKACHYTNLQPLWAKDNLSKGIEMKLTKQLVDQAQIVVSASANHGDFGFNKPVEIRELSGRRFFYSPETKQYEWVDELIPGVQKHFGNKVLSKEDL